MVAFRRPATPGVPGPINANGLGSSPGGTLSTILKRPLKISVAYRQVATDSFKPTPLRGPARAERHAATQVAVARPGISRQVYEIMTKPPDNLPVYRVLTGPDDAAFCHRVSDALALGYELFGSPSCTFDGSNVILAQAVVWPGAAAPVAKDDG